MRSRRPWALSQEPDDSGPGDPARDPGPGRRRERGPRAQRAALQLTDAAPAPADGRWHLQTDGRWHLQTDGRWHLRAASLPEGTQPLRPGDTRLARVPLGGGSRRRRSGMPSVPSGLESAPLPPRSGHCRPAAVPTCGQAPGSTAEATSPNSQERAEPRPPEVQPGLPGAFGEGALSRKASRRTAAQITELRPPLVQIEHLIVASFVLSTMILF
ncbi:hypothetical protein H1C71_020898 [Ictidomys tridecemlineatus]|nr:hypothetical protein H1C71_020898 [Ictidomys tridecemlineatus]